MRDPTPIAVLGASGHARVVACAIRAMGRICAGFYDRGDEGCEELIDGLPVHGHESLLLQQGPGAVRLANGVGGRARRADPGTALRRKLFERWVAEGFAFPVVIGAGAVVAPGTVLGPGAQIHAGAVVQPGCRIGANAIVNTRASIDHDARIGAHAHVAPGAVLCGGVSVGEGAFIGAGAVLGPGVRIGAGAVVGAGATVLGTVGPGATVLGRA